MVNQASEGVETKQGSVGTIIEYNTIDMQEVESTGGMHQIAYNTSLFISLMGGVSTSVLFG